MAAGARGRRVAAAWFNVLGFQWLSLWISIAAVGRIACGDLAAEVDGAQQVINAASAVQAIRVAQYPGPQPHGRTLMGPDRRDGL